MTADKRKILKPLKKVVRKILTLLYPKYGVYILLIIKNKIKRLLIGKADSIFLFVLAPPHSGSTLLTELINTSRNVSSNNPKARHLEGQFLPSVKNIMYVRKRHDPELDFDWSYIKKEWLKYWDLTKPVLLEKSPPNIYRVASIKRHFNPVQFIILYRNPYAHAESMMSRKKYSAQKSAELILKFLRVQKANIQNNQDAIVFSYEFLTEKPEEAVKLINKKMKVLGDIDLTRKFNAHNFMNTPLEIQNLNEQKINKINVEDLQTMSEVFKKEKDVLSFFGYEIM